MTFGRRWISSQFPPRSKLSLKRSSTAPDQISSLTPRWGQARNHNAEVLPKGGPAEWRLNDDIDAKAWFSRFPLAVPSEVHDGGRGECQRDHQRRASGRSRLRARRRLRREGRKRQEPAEVAH